MGPTARRESQSTAPAPSLPVEAVPGVGILVSAYRSTAVDLGLEIEEPFAIHIDCQEHTPAFLGALVVTVCALADPVVHLAETRPIANFSTPTCGTSRRRLC